MEEWDIPVVHPVEHILQEGHNREVVDEEAVAADQELKAAHQDYLLHYYHHLAVAAEPLVPGEQEAKIIKKHIFTGLFAKFMFGAGSGIGPFTILLGTPRVNASRRLPRPV